MDKWEYKRLLEQSAVDGTFPSYINDPTSYCLYRKDKTASCKQRCAIGVLIPDELYDPTIEYGIGTNKVLDKFNIKVDGLSTQDFLYIQSCHDENASECWDSNQFISDINNLDCFKV